MGQRDPSPNQQSALQEERRLRHSDPARTTPDQVLRAAGEWIDEEVFREPKHESIITDWASI